jgi:CheY-like chemotaxis protein
MPSRALLLSSDAKLIGLLQQVLGTACEVRVCKEIFSAVEEITGGTFQLLLLDWTEHLEAAFLVNAARELKSNRSAFVVAIVNSAQTRDALENGADATLAKPFTSTQALELLLPKLGVQNDASAGEPQAQEVSPPSDVCAVQMQAPAQPASVEREQKRKTSQKTLPPQVAPAGPSYQRKSTLPRMLSVTALVWPLVIAAAMLAFDHWPNRPIHSSLGISSTLAAAQTKVASFAGRWGRALRPAGKTERLPSEPPPIPPAIPITGDLLADYALPSPPGQAVLENPAHQASEPIDLSGLRLLPVSARIVAPVMTVEYSRVTPAIPQSLRYPPPAHSSSTFYPTGNLVAPDSARARINLPEAVSRALLERQVAPLYPKNLNAETNGIVVLRASIARDGSIHDLRLVSGYLALVQPAVDAVKHWRYKPYRHNGQNTEFETLITVDFKASPRG